MIRGNFVGNFVVISKGVHAYTQLRSSDITFVVMTFYVGHQNTFPGPVLYSFTSKNTVYFTNIMLYNTVLLAAVIVRFTSRGKLKVWMNKWNNEDSYFIDEVALCL